MPVSLGSHPRVVAATLFAVLLAPAAAKQGNQGPRVGLIGKVETHDGHPWANARVTLVHRPIVWRTDIGRADVLRVRTDERGAFRCDVLAARPYSCWATDGAQRATRIQDPVFGGVPIKLVEMPKPRVPLRVRVRGRSEWKQHGPLRVVFRALSDNVYRVDVPLDDKGEAALPDIGGWGITVEVWTRDGIPVMRRDTWLEPDRWGVQQRRAEKEPSDNVLELTLPRPLLLDVRVRDEKGRAVAGAEIRHQTVHYATESYVRQHARRHYFWRVAGETDRDGACAVTIPVPAGAKDQRVVLSARGPDRGFVMREDQVGIVGEDQRLRGAREYELALLPDKMVELALTDEGRPVAGAKVLVESNFVPVGTPATLAWECVVRSDEAGRLSVPALANGRRLTIVHARSGGDVTWTPTVIANAPPDKADKQRDFEIRLDALRFVELVLQKPDGMAPRAAEIVVQPEVVQENVVACVPFRFWTGRRGRLRVYLPPGDYSVLALAGRDFYARETLRVAAESSDRKQEQRRIALRPAAVISGRVVDTDQQPVAGAMLERTSFRARTFATRLDELLPSINWSLLRGETDADGKFRLTFVPHDGVLYTIGVEKEGVQVRQAVQVTSQTLEDLVIELSR